MMHDGAIEYWRGRMWKVAAIYANSSRGGKKRTKKKRKKKFLSDIQFSGGHRVSTSALICRSCNVKHPIFAGCVGACFYSVAKNIASVLDKNKAVPSGANPVIGGAIGRCTQRNCCFPARDARENQGSAERIEGEKEKKRAKITRQ